MVYASTSEKMRKSKASDKFLYGRLWWVAVCVAALIIVAGGLFIYFRPMWVNDAILRTRLKIAGIDSRYTQVGPYRVHYFVGGHGKPLLLIHGLGARAEDWAPEIPEYANHGFHVYVIDLLGCGRTSRPNISYSIAQQADMVKGFLDNMHVQQADLAGWSMGGWVALQYALAHPRRVKRLVVMDSAGLLFESNYGPEIFEPETPQQLAELTALLTPNPQHLPNFVIKDVLRRIRKNAPVIRRTVQTMLTGQDLLDGQLSDIQIPVLIVWGSQDKLIPISSGEQMHREMPQSVLEVFKGCGHLAPLTCANRIVPHVRQFLKSSPAMAGGTYQID